MLNCNYFDLKFRIGMPLRSGATSPQRNRHCTVIKLIYWPFRELRCHCTVMKLIYGPFREFRRHCTVIKLIYEPLYGDNCVEISPKARFHHMQTPA